MKCPNCGKEIADESIFCEFCGTQVVLDLEQKQPEEQVLTPKRRKTKIIAISISLALIIVVAIVGFIIVNNQKKILEIEIYNQQQAKERANLIADGYVDLGLPSGTLWKREQEDGFYTYDQAIEKFGGSLPTKEQLEELITCCEWIWNGSSYDVVSRYNAQVITFYIDGWIQCDGSRIDAYPWSYVWSSASDSSDRACGLVYVNPEKEEDSAIHLYDFYKCLSFNVRLVAQ